MPELAPIIRLAIRATQGLCSMLAVALIAGAFKTQSSFGYSAMLGSHATNFGLLMTYTALLYTLYDILVVEYFKIVPRFEQQIQLIIDGFFAVILFIAGLVLATSDYVKDCDAYATGIRCGTIKGGTAFTFIAMAAFIVSAALPFVTFGATRKSPDTTANDAPYVAEETPKAALSPIGQDGPSDRV